VSGTVLDDTVLGEDMRSRLIGLIEWNVATTVLFDADDDIVGDLLDAFLDRDEIEMRYLNDGDTGFIGYVVIENFDMSGGVDELETVDVNLLSADILRRFRGMSAANSGITDDTPGTVGSLENELEITVQDATPEPMEGYHAYDFEAVVDGEGPWKLNEGPFSDFSDDGAGVYTVTYTGADHGTEYTVDSLRLEGQIIEEDYAFSTPDET